MEEQKSYNAAATPRLAGKPGGQWWADLGCLALLLLLAGGMRAWQISHTEVTSRDSILYIRMAWRLEHSSWADVFAHSPHHPGYPLVILAVSQAVRSFVPDLVEAMRLSAQLTSALASLLLLVPGYYLGRALFDRRVAFWACLLFQCLPASGRILGDGLSEPLYLLLAVSGLLAALIAFRKDSILLFALCGLVSGLAYLTRPEGALVMGATGLVLLARQVRASSRRPWKRFLGCGLGLSAAGLAVVLPYMVAIDGLTVKNTGSKLIGMERADADWESALQSPSKAIPLPGPAQRTELATHAPLALWWGHDAGNISVWAVRAFVNEIVRGFFYVGWLPALLGLWWFRARLREPGAWVMLLVCAILCTLLYLVARRMGYLSERHLLLVILCGSYFATAATGVIGGRLADWLARHKPALAGTRWTDGRLWSVGLLLALTLSPLPRTLQPLHAERAGFREVGHWLAENTCAGDLVIDPYAWSYYYSGRVFQEGCEGLPVAEPRRFYVVLEAGKSKHEHLVPYWKAFILSQFGTPIRHWTFDRGKDRAEVVVYQVPLPLPFQLPLN
jgi:4-amino-4-deoxy-L-arabinose transferase-like glycosyltransferase